jgi:Apg6 BARA domain
MNPLLCSIENELIGGVSIKMHNTIEWSRALKFLLTNLKWLIAWTAKHERTPSSYA